MRCKKASYRPLSQRFKLDGIEGIGKATFYLKYERTVCREAD